MRHRLDPDLLLDEHAREERAHPALRARPIRDIDGVHASVLELPDVGDHARTVHTARRHDLDRRHELTRCDAGGETRSLRERSGEWRVASGGGNRGGRTPGPPNTFFPFYRPPPPFPP